VARNYGRYLFVQANLVLRVTDLKSAYLTSERIEARIREELPNVDRVLIHYEPKVKRMLRYAVPLADGRGCVGEHFGESPYFAFVEIDLREMRLSKQEIIANPHQDLAKGKGIKVAQFLLTYKPDVVITRESLAGKGPGYAFAEAGVEIVQTEARTLDVLIEGMKKKDNMRML
jgi:predicted Fe-Mo cluster-binding NifX family protein